MTWSSGRITVAWRANSKPLSPGIILGKDTNCFETIRGREDYMVHLSQSIDNDFEKFGIVIDNEDIFHAVVLKVRTPRAQFNCTKVC
jgi:hypothetical protein